MASRVPFPGQINSQTTAINAGRTQDESAPKPPGLGQKQAHVGREEHAWGESRVSAAVSRGLDQAAVTGAVLGSGTLMGGAAILAKGVRAGRGARQ